MTDTFEDRLARILPGGKGVWIPMDHGVGEYPEAGLERMDSTVDSVIEGGADAIILHKGVLSQQADRTGWGGFVCHVSASTVHGGPRSQSKVSVANAEECWQRGAMGVSGQVNLGDEAEPEMISQLGTLTTEAFPLGMPVLGMIYPRGPNLKIADYDDTGGVAHAARTAWERGERFEAKTWQAKPPQPVLSTCWLSTPLSRTIASAPPSITESTVESILSRPASGYSPTPWSIGIQTPLPPGRIRASLSSKVSVMRPRQCFIT